MHRSWDIRLQKCCDLVNRVRVGRGHWKCHHVIEHILASYWCSIVTMALSRIVSEIFNVQKCCDLEIGVRGHSRSLKVYHSVDRYGFLLVFFSNFVPKTHRFWDIPLLNIQWPWNPGWGSLNAIENYTIQSGTHDFLLTFHSNHWPISHRFQDKRRYPPKIANFSHPRVFNDPAEGFPVKLCIGAGISRN